MPNYDPLRIRDLVFDPPVLLAPMAGLTHLPFRRLCRRMGCGAVYTELVSVEGLVRKSGPTRVLLGTDAAERPVAAHLYGRDPAHFAEAARYCESLGVFDFIDINAGCPMPKILNRGDGAGLIRTPDVLRRIVAAVRAAVTLPVTVKTRIGDSPRLFNMLDLVKAVEDGGGDAIALHGRFTCNRHGGPADWEALARAKAAARIPVIGNGGIGRAEQVLERWTRSGVDGVMIGRAAIGNPWIFRQVRELLDGRTPTRPTPEERRAVMLEHLDGLIEVAARELEVKRRRKKEVSAAEAGARHFRAHLLHYLRGFRGLTEMKRHLNDIHSREDVVQAMDRVFDQNRDPAA